MNEGFSFGADPEIFVTEKGKPVSAFGLIPGTKDKPHPTSVGAVQVDGMALEFNINPTPARDFLNFNLNIVQTLRDMKAVAGDKYSFSKVSVQEFDEEYLAAQPEEAKVLGCDPDFNAYTLEPNPTPDGTRLFRTGAGHIHVGWGADIPIDNEEHVKICADFIKALDCTVGMFMTYIDREPRRRELYGKAGAFRPKPYGVEYRTPSNAWIFTKDYRQIIHGLVNQAITNQVRYPSDIGYATGGHTTSEEEVQRIINEGDFEIAKSILLSTNPCGRFNTLATTFARVIAKMEKELPSNG